MPLTRRLACAGPGAAAVRISFLRLLCFLALCLAATLTAAAELRGTVVGVADGDTVTVLDRARTQHKVRLAGVDAPERRQAFGERARQHLATLVFGKDVVVVWQKRDRYGRIVGQVLAPDCSCHACAKSLDAGLALVGAGLAWHYKQYENEQDPEDRQRYADAEEAARRSHVGLWRDTSPIAPWIFRRGASSAQIAPNLPSI
ncbi:MAG: thermonuclease family protein [Betaproteobacteria bacterium]|nr:thermonuclease family protein [Betaproteobacteria bacterium]